MPRGSLQIGLPRLEKYASSWVRTLDAEPVAQAELDQFAHRVCQYVMPTPSGFNLDTLSNTLAGIPI
jgi:hypothetical protein